jgi:hypothetical protein
VRRMGQDPRANLFLSGERVLTHSPLEGKAPRLSDFTDAQWQITFWVESAQDRDHTGQENHADEVQGEREGLASGGGWR